MSPVDWLLHAQVTIAGSPVLVPEIVGNVVGVPPLVQAKFYPSATMYVVYGLFCVIGFASWWQIQNRERTATPEPVAVG